MRLRRTPLCASLLILLSGAGWLKAALPPVVGQGSAQLTADDVNDMAALSQPLVAASLVPALVSTSVTSSKASQTELDQATIYFAPREADSRAWRGYCLRCYAAAIRWVDDNPAHWRKAGRWMTPASEEINEYIVPAPRGKNLPAWPVNDFASYPRVRLTSNLETALLLDLIETARGYSMLLRDGTELPFADLPLFSVYARPDQKGQVTGTVDVVPPRGRLKSSALIHVHSLLQKKNWLITGVDQYQYY